MATNVNSIIPMKGTHPGTILKKELMARGIKQKDFAVAIGMPASNLSELIKGKRNVTEGIALKLEKELGIPFQNWMNLQNRYYYVNKCQEAHALPKNMDQEPISSATTMDGLWKIVDSLSVKNKKWLVDRLLLSLSGTKSNVVMAAGLNESTYDTSVHGQ